METALKVWCQESAKTYRTAGGEWTGKWNNWWFDVRGHLGGDQLNNIIGVSWGTIDMSLYQVSEFSPLPEHSTDQEV